MSLFDESRHFFKLIEGVSRVLLDAPVENFSQVGVQSCLSGATISLGITELTLDLVESLNALGIDDNGNSLNRC